MIPRRICPILMYHKISGSKAYSRSWVTPPVFRKQMEALKSHGCQSINFNQFFFGRLGSPLPECPIIITFDDGYQGVFANAFPILKELGFVATLFITTSLVSDTKRRDNIWDVAKESKWPAHHLLWSEVAEMKREGFEIGSHGISHRPFTFLSHKDLIHELRYSKAILEGRLGSPVKVFSYPYNDGSKDPSIKKAIQDTGYTMAVASGGNPMEYLDTNDLFALRRKTMIELPFDGTFMRYVYGGK